MLSLHSVTQRTHTTPLAIAIPLLELRGLWSLQRVRRLWAWRLVKSNQSCSPNRTEFKKNNEIIIKKWKIKIKKQNYLGRYLREKHNIINRIKKKKRRETKYLGEKITRKNLTKKPKGKKKKKRNYLARYSNWKK